MLMLPNQYQETYISFRGYVIFLFKTKFFILSHVWLRFKYVYSININIGWVSAPTEKWNIPYSLLVISEQHYAKQQKSA